MQTLNDTRFTQLCYAPKSKLITQTWKFTAHKNHLHFFGNLSEVLDAVDAYPTQYLIIDFSNFKYPLDLNSRKWVVDHFLLHLAPYQLHKIALIKSSDSATQQTLELVLSNPKLSRLNLNFFDNVKQANTWFAKKTNASAKNRCGNGIKMF